MDELISIIIPVYNVERYIQKCIESIVNQTYKNLEIILIDDGSTDNSGKICDKYAKSDDRIIVKHIENQGVSNARNEGLLIAKGNYIGFVDGDDYIENNMYELMLKNAITNNTDLVICNAIYEDTNGINLEEYNSIEINFNNTNFMYNVINNLTIRGYLWNKLYARKLIYRLDGTFMKLDTDISILEDELYNLKIADINSNLKCLYIPNKLYHYIQRSDSALNKKFNIDNITSFIARNKEIEILEKNNIKTNVLKIHYIIGLNKYKIIMKKNKVFNNKKFQILTQKEKKYKKEISLKNINLKLKARYLCATKFKIVYYIKVYIFNENK